MLWSKTYSTDHNEFCTCHYSITVIGCVYFKLEHQNFGRISTGARFGLPTQTQAITFIYSVKEICFPIPNNTSNNLKIRFVTIYLLSTCENNHTWCTNVANLLRSIGYGEMWESRNIPHKNTNIGSMKHALKMATIRRYKDKWEIMFKIQKNTQYQIQSEFWHRTVVEFSQVPIYRHSVSQLMVSSHGLAIETGRHLRHRYQQ